jgi:hypothetical protein
MGWPRLPGATNYRQPAGSRDRRPAFRVRRCWDKCPAQPSCDLWTRLGNDRNAGSCRRTRERLVATASRRFRPFHPRPGKATKHRPRISALCPVRQRGANPWAAVGRRQIFLVVPTMGVFFAATAGKLSSTEHRLIECVSPWSEIASSPYATHGTEFAQARSASGHRFRRVIAPATARWPLCRLAEPVAASLRSLQ